MNPIDRPYLRSFLALTSQSFCRNGAINVRRYWPYRRHKPLGLQLPALIQLSALGYGLWTVFVARPVHLVFEIDRFRVVHAIDIPPEELPLTPPGVEAMPLLGPTLLSLRPFRDTQENMDATMAALQGASLGARPGLWQPYAAGKADLLKVVRPVAELKRRFAPQAAAIDSAVAHTGRHAEALVYLPMVGRKSFWTVLLDPITAEPLAFVPLDSF